MLKNIFLLILISFCTGIQAQQINSSIISRKIIFTKDTIRLEKVSIDNNNFKIFDSNKTKIDSTYYQINFSKAILIFSSLQI